MRMPRMLIACFLALAVNLIAVQAAQAIEWSIKGTELIDVAPSGESISSSGENFELSVPKLSLTIKCKSESGTGTINQGGLSSASITLSGCEAGSKFCAVKSPGQSSGTLAATLETKILEKEVSEVPKTYDELTPQMTIEISGAGCTLPKELKMKGKTAAEVPQVGTAGITRAQKFSKAIAEQAGVTSLALGENQAFLTGTIVEKLSGANANEQVGTLFFWARPRSLALGGVGPAFAKPVTITNLSNVRDIKIIAITVFMGNYTIDEPMPACKGLTVAPQGTCTVSVVCNAAGNGMFEVEADLLDANNNIIGNDGKQVTMTC